MSSTASSTGAAVPPSAEVLTTASAIIAAKDKNADSLATAVELLASLFAHAWPSSDDLSGITRAFRQAGRGVADAIIEALPKKTAAIIQSLILFYVPEWKQSVEEDPNSDDSDGANVEDLAKSKKKRKILLGRFEIALQQLTGVPDAKIATTGQWMACAVHIISEHLQDANHNEALAIAKYAAGMFPRFAIAFDAAMRMDLSHRTRVKTVDGLGSFSMLEDSNFQSGSISAAAGAASRASPNKRRVPDTFNFQGSDRPSKRNKSEVCYGFNANICQRASCIRMHTCVRCAGDHPLVLSPKCVQGFDVNSIPEFLRASAPARRIQAAVKPIVAAE